METLKEFKKKVNKGFRMLRKKGYIAKQNFLCCQGCGWSELESMYSSYEMKKVVFYHKQDNENLIEDREFYICWDGDGKEIVEIFKECGLSPVWDGDFGKRILIK